MTDDLTAKRTALIKAKEDTVVCVLGFVVSVWSKNYNNNRIYSESTTTPEEIEDCGR